MPAPYVFSVVLMKVRHPVHKERIGFQNVSVFLVVFLVVSTKIH